MVVKPGLSWPEIVRILHLQDMIISKLSIMLPGAGLEQGLAPISGNTLFLCKRKKGTAI
jgi:hypothetical protein